MYLMKENVQTIANTQLGGFFKVVVKVSMFLCFFSLYFIDYSGL